MLTTNFTRAERSKVFIDLIGALQCDARQPRDAQTAWAHAFAETTAFFSDGCASFALAEVFALSEALLILRDECEAPVAKFNFETLREIVGDPDLVRLALGLSGFFYCPTQRAWVDGDGRIPAAVGLEGFRWD